MKTFIGQRPQEDGFYWLIKDSQEPAIIDGSYKFIGPLIPPLDAKMFRKELKESPVEIIRNGQSSTIFNFR